MITAGWVACLCQIHHVRQTKLLLVIASKMTTFATPLSTDQTWIQLVIGNVSWNNKIQNPSSLDVCFKVEFELCILKIDFGLSEFISCQSRQTFKAGFPISSNGLASRAGKTQFSD